jgi:acyl-coenzyme A thioesterase PaaI-like protein
VGRVTLAVSVLDEEPAGEFGLHDWVEAYRPPVPDTFVVRRALADRLAAISTRLIRVDLPDAELAALDTELAAIEAKLDGVRCHSHFNQYVPMAAGKATPSQVMMAFDYDAVTGASNPAAPRLRFDLDAENVTAHVTLEALHEGGPGNAHGGVLSALLDVVLARVPHAQGYIGVTGYLNVRYLVPTPLYNELTFKAWPVSRIGRVTRVAGGVWLGDLQTVAAEAMYVVPKRK